MLRWSKACATKTTGKVLSAIPLHNFLAFWSCTKEASVAARSGPGDVILQGFVRVKQANQRKMLEHLSEDGLFIEFLAKPDVYWIPPFEEEDPKTYLSRVCADARNEGTTVAYRKGGGVCLGLRVLKRKCRLQMHAWSLSGAGANWDAQDVTMSRGSWC